MTHSTRRGLATGAFALSAALLLAGCAGGGGGGEATDGGDDGDGELTQIKLQLQWLPQAQFAGYFAAADQ
ncbi:MAG TPA: ABC transporter substrate-binding protein, partial [Microbacterium sp.]|nr:ABC transporter substrate-binding protein [Microbacterium sp.]